MIRIRIKKRSSKKILLTLVAILVSIPMIFPLYWILISSLKTDAEIFATPQTFFPHHIIFDNYIEQLQAAGTLQAFFNSLLIAGGSMILSVSLAVPCAYGLAKFRMYGKGVFIMTFLVTQMLPSSLVLTPLFLTYNKLNLLNTYWAPILSTATISIPFVVLVLRPIFREIPGEIEEAARIDGCNRFTAFFRIILPLGKSGLVTAMTFSFIYGWNDLIYSITFNSLEILRPMTAAIYNYIDLYGTRWNMIMAYGIILVIPIVIIFVFLQKYVVDGLISGSVKG